jgi:prolipoprotein diacylglyceryl transferase
LIRAIPSPTVSSLELGPFTFHLYALCIITGIAIAIWLGDKRFRSHAPDSKSVVSEVAITAVPVGIIGGRIYHVITSPDAYFGSGGNPVDAFKIWEGGLGIWGAISLGVLGAWLRYRQLGKRMQLPNFALFLDALAPGILFAQAMGRFGNWFNIELFGKPLIAPWALEVPAQYRPTGYSAFETFHPTFLYESLWCAILAFVLIKFGKRLAPGQIFSLYVMVYSIGRLAIESIRIDSAHTIAGLRLNIWVSLIVVVGGAVIFRMQSRKVD